MTTPFMKRGTTLVMLFALALATVFTACDPEPEPVEAPTAAFGLSKNGLEVTFIDASVGADTYAWDFGDGNTSADAAPVHTYAAEGTYTVSLTVTNEGGSDSRSEDVTVEEADKIKNFVAGKTWQLARGEVLALSMGPNEGGTWEGYNTHTWFSVGDKPGSSSSAFTRISVFNDYYTFNADGTYTVDFSGDYWGEFGIWAGTEFNETHIDITGGALPANVDAVDMTPLITGPWQWVVDEEAQTLEVVGDGAHIINPRYKNGETDYLPGSGIKYNVYKTVENASADTLVLYIDTHDNDFGSDPRWFMTFVHYYVDEPVISEGPTFTAVDFAEEISSSTISHTFEDSASVGTGVDAIYSSSIVEYGVTIADLVGTKVTRTDADGGFTDFKLQSTDADIRFDDNGSYDFSKAQIQVYVPSTNDFSGALANQVVVKLADQSGMGPDANGLGPGFWNNWVTLTQADIALDQWVTLTFDFTGLLDDAEAQSGIRDNVDLVIIEFGGSGHGESGEVYYRDFKFIQ